MNGLERGAAVIGLLLLCMFFPAITPDIHAAEIEGAITRDALDDETLCGIGRRKKCDMDVAVTRGLFETGLRPQFPDGLNCRDIDEQWAIDYSGKRGRTAYHGGIDMPAPFGTPIIAVADGTVVGKFSGERSYRGRELVLRHSPEDTGLPVWTYTLYAHFDEMPSQNVGDRVKMGEVLGPTGNSGRGRNPNKQSAMRRPAIHFAVWFTESPEFVAFSKMIVPLNSYWMDPNALYRKVPPFDSASVKALPDDEKKIKISVMLDDGSTIPADTKIVWPYTCSK